MFLNWETTHWKHTSEWKLSRFAREKISCQSCHMENRSHTWKGIHDKDFVRNALDIQFSYKKRDSVLELTGSIESKISDIFSRPIQSLKFDWNCLPFKMENKLPLNKHLSED